MEKPKKQHFFTIAGNLKEETSLKNDWHQQLCVRLLPKTSIFFFFSDLLTLESKRQLLVSF